MRISSVRRQASAPARAILAAALLALSGAPGDAQDASIEGLSVLPVTIELAPGQMTAVITLQNHTGREVDFQVRPYAWDQAAGGDRLTPTDTLVASPPLGRIPVGAEQVVRLVLRQPAQGQEVSYRILLDQVPPPPQAGVVNFALRLSIPVFAEAPTHGGARLRWSIQSAGGAYYLEAVNTGARHEVFRDMALTAADGRRIALESNVSPYVLPGGTRRWRVLTTSFAPPRETLRLTARADSGPVDQPVSGPSAGP